MFLTQIPSIMKTLILTLVGIVSLVAFTENNRLSPDQYNLEGVWELKYQFLYDHNEVSDTIFNPNGYRQVKMYSKGRVMWTRFDPADNNEWFGYGTYTIKDGILEERLEYASGTMMKIIDTTEVFRFELVMGPNTNTYKQVSLTEEGNYSISESYQRIE